MKNFAVLEKKLYRFGGKRHFLKRKTHIFSNKASHQAGLDAHDMTKPAKETMIKTLDLADATIECLKIKKISIFL